MGILNNMEPRTDPCLEPGGLQRAYTTQWKKLARYFNGGKTTAANLEHNSYLPDYITDYT